MGKVRIVHKPDKSVAIIYPAPKSRRKDETEQQWLERVFVKAMIPHFIGFPYDDIDSSELPQTREYRNAWEFDNVEKKVKINQVKKDAIDVEKADKAADKQALADLIKDKKDGKI